MGNEEGPRGCVRQRIVGYKGDPNGLRSQKGSQRVNRASLVCPFESTSNRRNKLEFREMGAPNVKHSFGNSRQPQSHYIINCPTTTKTSHLINRRWPGLGRTSCAMPFPGHKSLPNDHNFSGSAKSTRSAIETPSSTIQIMRVPRHVYCHTLSCVSQYQCLALICCALAPLPEKCWSHS